MGLGVVSLKVCPISKVRIYLHMMRMRTTRESFSRAVRESGCPGFSMV